MWILFNVCTPGGSTPTGSRGRLRWSFSLSRAIKSTVPPRSLIAMACWKSREVLPLQQENLCSVHETGKKERKKEKRKEPKKNKTSRTFVQVQGADMRRMQRYLSPSTESLSLRSGVALPKKSDTAKAILPFSSLFN